MSLCKGLFERPRVTVWNANRVSIGTERHPFTPKFVFKNGFVLPIHGIPELHCAIRTDTCDLSTGLNAMSLTELVCLSPIYCIPQSDRFVASTCEGVSIGTER